MHHNALAHCVNVQVRPPTHTLDVLPLQNAKRSTGSAFCLNEVQVARVHQATLGTQNIFTKKCLTEVCGHTS